MDSKHLENRKIWHNFAEDFSITEDCNNCLKCVRICPTGNIKARMDVLSSAINALLV